MSIDRSKRVKNMFAAPKTAEVVTKDPVATAQVLLKTEIEEPPLEVIQVALDDIVTTEGNLNKESLISDSKPPSKDKKDKKEKLVAAKPVPPKTVIAKKLKGTSVHIGFRVSKDMKEALENMANDFAYLARKEYGIKIKDDTSSIQRAFLMLGMSCFTENVRHKILKEYDNESEMQDEVSQQLIALMRIHKVEINDIDFDF